jgi:hypothetical protein
MGAVLTTTMAAALSTPGQPDQVTCTFNADNSERWVFLRPLFARMPPPHTHTFLLGILSTYREIEEFPSVHPGYRVHQLFHE